MTRKVIISSEAINSHGFRVITDGIDFSQFQKNPILLYMHTRAETGREDEIRAIGTVANLKVEGANLTGELCFSKEYDFAQQIEKQWDEGVYRSVSPGLDPVEWSEDEKLSLPGQRLATLVKSRLIELSVVDIGSNPDALALDYSEQIVKLSISNNYNIPKLKTVKKMKTLLLKMGLSENSEENDAIAAFEKLKAENIRLQNSLSNVLHSAIKDVVSEAVRLKKIPLDKEAHFIEMGVKVGLENLKITLSAISAPVEARPLSVIKPNGSPIKAEVTNFNDLSIHELEELKRSDIDSYVSLYRKEYGILPTDSSDN